MKAALSAVGKRQQPAPDRPIGLVRAAKQVLPSPQPTRVAVVVPRADHPLTARAAKAWPEAVVVTFVSEGDTRSLLDTMVLDASFDLVLDAVGRALKRRLDWLHPLVRAEGLYVARLPRRRQGAAVPGWVRKRHPSARTNGGCVVVGARTDLLIPLREPTQDAVLRAQPARGRVLLTTPPETLTRRGTFSLSRPMPGIEHPATFEVPSLSLREHLDVTCAPYQVAYDDAFALAASFREFDRTRVMHKFLERGPHGYLVRPTERPDPLPGRWFYFDTNIPDHFGHAVTEQLSHVWGWRAAKERHPDLRALVFAPPSGEVSGWAWDLWEAAGVPRADVEVVHRPVLVERLVTCSPMLRIGQYVHPAMREVWDVAGDRLSSPSVRDAWPERIFHTRGGRRRACRNRAEVEELFRSEGFEIISPAEYSLAEQVQLARHARTIAGFAGSGMYQIAFTGKPLHVVAIAAEAYAAHNEHLIAGLLGHRLDVIVCRADVPRADPGKFSGASYASAFEFDMHEDADTLRTIMS